MPHPYDNIPATLKQRPNWVVWGIRDAPPKSPYNPISLLSDRPNPAKAGVPETWSRYQDAAKCVRQGLARGIGYEFDGRPSPAGSVCGVDLDHVISENGVTPEAREIVGLLNSYTEVSPSGTGLHIFVLAPGANITRHRKKEGFVEIYSEGRYFTVTGHISSLYEAFPAPKARELAKRLEMHHTPKHGSWLNIAEIIISILARQCLCRRIPFLDLLNQEIRAWNLLYNAFHKPINWQFTTDDTRVKLKHLYPLF